MDKKEAMTKEKLGKLYPIEIKKYNPEWKNYFKKEKCLLQQLFSEELLIEHIGSTAIIGLSAKPTIDVLMQQPSNLTDIEIIAKFENNNYIHMKEQKNHLMFVKGYTPSGLEEISYHIHMGNLDHNWLWDRIYFRDYLNLNKDIQVKYEILKRVLAEEYKNDREAYTNAKAHFITETTIKAVNYFKYYNIKRGGDNEKD